MMAFGEMSRVRARVTGLVSASVGLVVRQAAILDTSFHITDRFMVCISANVSHAAIYTLTTLQQPFLNRFVSTGYWRRDWSYKCRSVSSVNCAGSDSPRT